MEEFYYQKMDRQKQAVYHGMLQGVLQLADQIQLPRVDGKELYDIFFQMRLDHPEIFWVVGFSWKYYPDSPNLIFVPEYLFEKGKIKEHQIALTSRVEKLARQAQGLSEWEKEKYVHDFICKNVRYDKLKKPYSHEIIGPLGQGVGVCEGIAKAVKVLCDALGLEAFDGADICDGGAGCEEEMPGHAPLTLALARESDTFSFQIASEAGEKHFVAGGMLRPEV